jgi:hypothetical protein
VLQVHMHLLPLLRPQLRLPLLRLLLIREGGACRGVGGGVRRRVSRPCVLHPIPNLVLCLECGLCRRSGGPSGCHEYMGVYKNPWSQSAVCRIAPRCIGHEAPDAGRCDTPLETSRKRPAGPKHEAKTDPRSISQRHAMGFLNTAIWGLAIRRCGQKTFG